MTAEGVNWLFECWGSERDLLCVGYHGDLPELRAPGGGDGGERNNNHNNAR